MPRIIRRDPRIQQRQTRPDDIGQIIPHQLPHLLRLGQKRHQTAAENPRHQQRDDLESPHVVPAREVGAAEDGDDGDHARGDGEEGGGFAAVAEVFDEGRLVGGHGAVGDEAADCDEGEEVGLGVGEGLEDLGGFELTAVSGAFVAVLGG